MYGTCMFTGFQQYCRTRQASLSRCVFFVLMRTSHFLSYVTINCENRTKTHTLSCCFSMSVMWCAGSACTSGCPSNVTLYTFGMPSTCGGKQSIRPDYPLPGTRCGVMVVMAVQCKQLILLVTQKQKKQPTDLRQKRRENAEKFCAAIFRSTGRFENDRTHLCSGHETFFIFQISLITDRNVLRAGRST